MTALRELDVGQIARFLVVGCLNTAFSYLIYACALYIGLSFVWANLCAVVSGVLVSFRMQRGLVFGEGRSGAFLRYIAFWAVIWVINIFIIWLMKIFVQDSYIAGALALIPVTIISYFVQKIWVFA